MDGLRAVAKELNVVLGLEPKIDFDTLDRTVLVGQVLEAAVLLEDGDEVSEKTRGILNKLKGVEEKKTEKSEIIEEVDVKKEQIEMKKEIKKMEKKNIIEKTKYGHRRTSMAGFIDEAIDRGESLIQIAVQLMEKFHKPELLALQKAAGHAKFLAVNHGVKFKGYREKKEKE